MSDHRIVALCAGYGGLEAAVTAGLGGEVVAFAESDPYAARVFSAHHPAAPNLGDVMTADWKDVLETYRPDVVAAGFPCRNISNAGDRTGIEGKWSRVWKGVAEAVRVLRPGLVVLENVSAILRRGIDTVVADLAAIGYDARWTCLRASEVGAPHPRDRWVCIAHPADADPDQLGRYRWAGDLPGSTGRLESEDPGHEVAAAPAGLSLLPTPAARDWKSGASNLLGRNARPLNEIVVNGLDDRWVAGEGTDYGPAIRRWERITGRAAPCPTESGTRGNRRLSPAFTEWMMGLPEGWVTDVPDVPRREQLRILGNGAVPHQMYEGLTRLFTMDVDRKDDMSTTQDKPRGKCTGCAFEYQLAAARSGEHKGSLVIRKHNSRTGPGLCAGAGLPPRVEESVAEAMRNAATKAVGEVNCRHLAGRLPITVRKRGDGAMEYSRFPVTSKAARDLKCSPAEVARMGRPEREDRVRKLLGLSHWIVDRAVEKYFTSHRLTATAVLYSGGNDSTVLAHIFRRRADVAVHANTGIGIEETRNFVRETCSDWSLPLVEKQPRERDSYRQQILDAGFPGPAQHYKMYQRLKERCLEQARSDFVKKPREERILFLGGRRRSESARRSAIPTWDRKGSMCFASPLTLWTKPDLNTYRLMAGDVPVNRVSDLIHMSGECLCGAFAEKEELDLVSDWFPEFRTQVRELEALIAHREDIPEERRRWGWGAYRGERRSQERDKLFRSGPLCGSCDDRMTGGTTVIAPACDRKDDMSTTQDKPRGKCTGCAFEYQLAAARSGEHKGSLVIRKHNSRTGPGLCAGAGLPPREATTDLGESVEGPRIGADEAVEMNTRHLAERRKNPELPETDVHRGRKEDCAESNCVPPAEPKKHCRPGGCRGCCGCSAVCTKNPCGDPEGYRGPFIEALKAEIAEVGSFAAQAEAIVSGAVPVVERTVQAIAAAVGEATGFTAQVEAIASGAVPVVDPVVAAVPEMFADPAPTTVGDAVDAPSAAATAVSFADPAPVAAEMAPVSGQPEPDRDGWGRYVIHKQPHTRATSFAKLGSSTYALGEWNERMLIKGLTERPDLLAMAHGLDVRADKTRLNAIADDAQTHAGNKVAANIGTSLHKFTERLDAGLITLDEVPPMWRARCKQYLDAVAAYGLRTRADWIERTTAVRADQVSAPLPVAGTLDRIWGVPNGDLVIGDLKSGRDLSYSWVEIAVQLAVYAHGVNTFGLFDWRTKTWTAHIDVPGGMRHLQVRTDFAIVVHLPAEGYGCDLYRVDLVKGWEYAQVSGRVQSRQKDKSIAAALTTLDVMPSPETVPPLIKAEGAVHLAQSHDRLREIYEYARASGRFSDAELTEIKAMCADRYEELYPQL